MKLIDAEKLCYDLLHGWHTKDEEYSKNVRNVILDVVTPIIVNQLTTSIEWISVKDRLPKNEEFILVYLTTFDCVEKATYSDNEFYDPLLMEVTKYVTHWMPLPEPPKEK